MYRDIDEARVQHTALRQIVERHVGAGDWRALRRVLELCRHAADTVEDRYCREKLRLVQDCSAEMFSHGESRVPLIKRRILDALELVASRLYNLEALRRAGLSG